MPDVVGPAVAGFALPAMALLLAGSFVLPLVLGLGFAGAAGAVVAALWRDLPGRRGGPLRRRDALWALAALLVAAAFTAVNARWSAQDIYATRDPATYVLAGRWLADHPDQLVTVHREVFDDAGYTPDSPGFRTDLISPGSVYAQGNHLLPALLAVSYRLAGAAGLFGANSAFGGLALLALFAFARRVTGGGPALAVTAVLAASMPMSAFSRDTFTEPLTLLFVFGGLSLLWRAVETGRHAQYLLAGLTAGSAAMARIDGQLALDGVLVAAVVLLLAAPPGRRLASVGRVAPLVAGLVATAAVGYLDVTRYSSGYYHDLRGQILMVLAAGAAVAAAGLLAVAVAWATPLAGWILAVPRRRVWGAVAATLILAGFAVLASRPFWLVTHGSCDTSVGALQRGLGLPHDPCRVYSEYSLSWLAWYVGWPTVAAGVVGLALLAYRALRDADTRPVALLAVTLLLAGVYLVDPNIVPDQVWAMRRFLPVVLPGLLVAAGAVLALVASRWRWGPWLAATAALAAVAYPAYVTAPLVRVRTGVPQYAQISGVCRALPGDAAVLSLGTSSIGSYVQTVRSFCGVPAAAMPSPSTERLARVRATALRHGRTLFVIAERPGTVPFAGPAPAPFSVAHVRKWPERLVDVPSHPVAVDVPVYVGRVGPDGTVTPAGH